MRRHLIAEVISILREAGFLVSSPCDARSFDFVARRDDVMLLLKVLQNIDAVSEEVARSMRRVAFLLVAAPLIVGERKGGLPLEDDVVYYRYGIPAVNPQTLYDYLIAGIPLCAYSTSGGIFVAIDGEAMQEARERKNLSLGEIASELGVSRRSVSKYEQGASTTIDIALKLEEILETSLIQPLDIFKAESTPPPASSDEQPRTSLERYILKKMERIGFEIFAIHFAPFNAVSVHGDEQQRHRYEPHESHESPHASFASYPSSASSAPSAPSDDKKAEFTSEECASCTYLIRECEKMLTGISKCTSKLIKRAKIVSSISEITGTKSVFVVNGKIKRLQIDRTVLIRREELEQIKDADELSYLIEERAVS